MRFDIVTIFPAMVEQVLAAGIVGRAIERGTLDVTVWNLRDFTIDRHRVVDDVPYGGGPGMVLKPEPIFRALDAIQQESEQGKQRGVASVAPSDGPIPGTAPFVVLTSPQGTRLTQAVADRLSRAPHLVLLCGRYEGVDERVRSRVDEEISIGDYVLSGGEVPALVIVDAVARLIPGVVGDQLSVADDSFSRGLLDFPQYTRPAELLPGFAAAPPASPGTMKVPDVLLSGNHAEIRRWRKREAVSRTLARRPDLLEAATLDDEERAILRQLKEQDHERH
jgi:tRNA (guanine37-N1)-methyltransferase